MILAKHISHRYGEKVLFEDAGFYVDYGQKVGLVGVNGSGKTTLMRMICGTEIPDEGTIEHLGNVTWVPQEIKKDTEMDSCPHIRNYVDPNGTVKEYEIKRLLAGLELDKAGLEQAPGTLSGGQKTRLALVRAILEEPDILLLDEPTNFLDVEGKKWLMEFLGRYKKTLIIISHDLELLDKNMDKVLYINPQKKTVVEYAGNYSKFVHQKEIDDALLKRKIENENKHIARMKEGLVKMAHMKSEKGVRQRLNLEKRVEKMIENLPEMPEEAKKIKIQLPEPLWVGELPVFLKGVNKSYGEKKVLTGINFDIKRGERIALIGANGAGKSTLIKIITGTVKPDSGEVVADNKLKIGYYSQELEDLPGDKTLYQYIQQISAQKEGPVRSILAKMLFDKDKIYQKIQYLSGGEKTRLSITALLMQNFNLLILDEPTTFLDPMSQRLILEAIKEYKGSLLFVSHVPEFVDGLAPQRKFLVAQNKWLLKSSNL